MYYVNREQIELRLNVLPEIVEVLKMETSSQQEALLERYAKERALHLAIEVVTDVGSLLIDCFIMRDASSYEDIIDIIHGEQVIDASLHELMIELVRQRRPLVQDYIEVDYSALSGLSLQLIPALNQFAEQVRSYLLQEGITT